jgi:hypothetical protein
MKQILINILNQHNLHSKELNIEIIYQAGIENIMNNLEYYHDKSYTCESVIKELFRRGVLNKIQEYK